MGWKIIGAITPDSFVRRYPDTFAHWNNSSSYVRVRGTNLLYNCLNPVDWSDKIQHRWLSVNKTHPQFHVIAEQDGPNSIYMPDYIRGIESSFGSTYSLHFLSFEDILTKIPDPNIKAVLIEIFSEDK